jgi:hypothetical protein
MERTRRISPRTDFGETVIGEAWHALPDRFKPYRICYTIHMISRTPVISDRTGTGYVSTTSISTLSLSDI